jgi:hypothetical protein
MLLELVEDGMLSKDDVIMACVKYMSEDDVKDMMQCNEFIEPEDDEPDVSEQQEWADFDADC